ncbi:MAG: diadenylate cyclase CdaA [Planctomycetota bacterium]
MYERFNQLLARLGEYSFWEVGVELILLWALIYLIYRFVRGTRAAGALKGLLVLLVVATLLIRIVAEELFPRLEILYDKFLGIAAIAVIVTFQPELRRALLRLGEAPFVRSTNLDVPKVIDAVGDAAAFLSRNKFGAIMAIERNVGLRETAESGRLLNADVSAHLLNTIFWPNSPLHDMGVIIRGRRIVAAGAQFPLVEAGELPDQHLGTRHRAALGLARATDALVVVVSEETGAISLAEGRRLIRWLTPERLREELMTRLSGPPPSEEDTDEPEVVEEQSGG